MPTTRSGLSFDPTAFYQVPIEFDPPNLDGPTTPHIQAIDPNGYVSPIYDPTRHLTRSFLRHRITTLIVTGSRSMGSRSMPPSCSRRLLRRIFDSESLPEGTQSTNPKTPKDPEFVPTFVADACKISRFDPEFAAKIEALARFYSTLTTIRRCRRVGSMTESEDYSMPDGHIIGNDLWTTEIEDVAIEKAKITSKQPFTETADLKTM
jgi:hypothetical protein